MSEITYKDLLKMAEIIPNIEPKIIYLPAIRVGNRKYELVGIDAEVLKFHAEQSNTEWQPSEFLEVGQYMMMDKPKSPFSMQMEIKPDKEYEPYLRPRTFY